MMQGILNAMKAQANLERAGMASVRNGTVTSYNPNDYTVRVTIEPEGAITGWIPLCSPWVGNGWGMFAPPSIGDMVEVQYSESDFESGFACLRFYNDQDRPLAVQSGEFWLVHSSGSFLKFKNDGSVLLNTASNLTATVGGDLSATVSGTSSVNSSGNMSLTAPNITLTGNTVIDGALTQGAGSNGGACTMNGPLTVTHDVIANGISLDNHEHPVKNVQGGTSTILTEKPQ